MFKTFLDLGFDHILDKNGYDHILFVLALCAVYAVRDWKKILILVTAFTLGHSLTLALSALRIISVPTELIETLIPITIILTGLFNIFQSGEKRKESSNRVLYSLALFFGFIHGMGFSNYFRALMGDSENIVLQLFAFNVGVELGQIIIVAIAMVISYILIDKLKVPQKYWNWTVSGLAILAALHLIFF